MAWGRNPYNAQNTLFQKLTRLLSGPIVNYRRQTEKALRNKQLGKYALNLRDTNGKQFKKTQYNPFESLQSSAMCQHQRAQRYVDFREMEFTPEISSALDIFADEITTSSKLSPMLSINCANEEIKEVLRVLYHDVLNLDYNLFGWVRSMCKFGDFFLYLDIEEAKGVIRTIGLPAEEVERVEGEDKTNPDYIQFQWSAGGLVLENWQVAHFRNLGEEKFWPYGSSILDPARRIFRQLDLLEQAVMTYRIVRSPERRVFYIDVGNIPPTDIEPFMQRVMTQMKRQAIADTGASSTGRVDLRFNPLSVQDDYYIPVRGSTSGTKIESLPGGSYTGDIDDIKYLRDKLFSALKIPMSYLSHGDGSAEGQEGLAQKDLRFARTIQRLQRAVTAELTKIGLVHLYVLGYRGPDLLAFSLALNNPSKIAELQELEQWRTKFDVASGATEGFFSRRWIAEKIFNLSEEEYLRNQREMFYDRALDAKLASIGEGASTEGGVGDIGMTPEEEVDAAETMADLESGDSGADADGSESDSMLLAAPGKRNEPHLTPGSNGKVYVPEKTDKRDMGARKRHMQSKFNKEKSSSAERNIFQGYSAMKTLSRGINESVEPDAVADEDQEAQILSINFETKRLLERLETKFRVIDVDSTEAEAMELKEDKDQSGQD